MTNIYGHASLTDFIKNASEDSFLSMDDLEQSTRISPKMQKTLFRAINQFGTNSDTGNKYWDHVPIAEIRSALEDYGYTILQEDNTPWEGLILGEDGRASIPIGVKRRGSNEDGSFKETYEQTNRMLILSWYKTGSGRYEITVYIS